MNIMNKLTLKHIRKNKARTIMTILGVIISVAMLTAVTTGMNSGMNWMRNVMYDSEGRWHIQYKDIAADKFSEFAKAEDPGETFMAQAIGFAKVKEPKKESKPYLYIQAVNETAFSNYPLKLEEGRFPENKNEIVISRNVITDGCENVKIGDSVTYELGERYIKSVSSKDVLEENGLSLTKSLNHTESYYGKNTKLYYYDKNNKEHTGTAVEELRLNGEKQTYKVVGIISRPGDEILGGACYYAFTSIDSEVMNSNTKVNGYVYYRNVTNKVYKDAVKDALSLGLKKPGNEIPENELTIGEIENVEVNQSVLYYEGVAPDKGFTMFLMGMYLLLIIIIMVGSITLIYNSFAISISERSKQLGMLSSVGATKRQKRNTVFFEALVYGVVGIPVGILSGIMGISIAFKVVSPILLKGSSITVPLTLTVSLMSVVISIIVAIITIVISAYIPAIRASRISPIDAIRQSKDIKITKKKVRTSKLNRMLFGFEGELALKNMKRNRKRYRSIIFSLFISVVLFITVSAFIYYITGAYTEGIVTSNYDVRVMMNSEDQKIDNKLVDELRKTPFLAQVSRVGRMGIAVQNDTKYVSDEVKTYVKADIASGVLSQDYEQGLNFMLYALDDESYKAYSKEAGIETTEISSKMQGILINKLQVRRDYSVDNVEATNLKAGDTIVLQNDPLSTGETNENAFSIPIQVAATTDCLPIGIVSYGVSYTSTIYLVVPESIMNQVKKEAAEQSKIELPIRKSLLTKSATDESMSKEIKEVLNANGLVETKYELYDVKADEESGRQLVYAVSIFAYGFIILMSLICCANMCNTISTSIALRRSEFAMLKSVGMTPKRFHRMIMFESILYGVKALAYGLPVSIVCSYGIYRIVTDRFEIGFMIPAYIYLGTFALVFVIVGSAMFYSSRKIRKENIIDGLRNDIV